MAARYTVGPRRSADGVPESLDELALWLHGRPDRLLRIYLSQVATDADGRFELRHVPPSFAVELRPASGRLGWPQAPFDAPPSDGTLAWGGDERLTASLSGTLVESDGAAPARGVVHAVRRTGGERMGRLDAHGAFAFDALPEGTFDLLARVRGRLPRVVATVTLNEGESRALGALPAAR